jgi:hypothetical protein
MRAGFLGLRPRMNRIVVLALILLATVAYACGPRARSAEPERARPKTVEGPPILSQLDVKIRDGIEFAFRVTNNEPRKIELLFPSGQTHDFAVVDSLGRTVWRWSDGRMFTQAYQNKFLASGDSFTIEGAWRAEVAPGKYVAVASLKSENNPLEQRVSFEVR